MRPGRRMIVAALLALAAPAAAAKPPVSTVASFGPAPVVGIGARRFEAGRAFGLDVTWRPERSTTWIVRAGRTELSRAANLLTESAAGGFFDRGVLWVPPRPESEVEFRSDHLQLGIRHTEPLGRARPWIEAAIGASLVRDERSRIQGLPMNDRRAAWEARPELAGEATGPAPSFAVGLGVETALPGRIALASMVSADFTAVHGLVGAVVPVRFGARWPAGPLPEIVRAPGEGPRLRASAGWSHLGSPSWLAGPGATIAAELELPIGERLAVSMVGEHATRVHRETLFRQEIDSFGNSYTVPAGTIEASLAATAVTVGLRAHHRSGPLTFSIRGGTGWGRTSGFGASIETPEGAYLDANGNWIPAWTLIDVGAGQAATGFAWAASAGVELRVAGPLRAFAEGGITAIELGDQSVRSSPLRFGAALR